MSIFLAINLFLGILSLYFSVIVTQKTQAIPSAWLRWSCYFLLSLNVGFVIAASYRMFMATPYTLGIALIALFCYLVLCGASFCAYMYNKKPI